MISRHGLLDVHHAYPSSLWEYKSQIWAPLTMWVFELASGFSTLVQVNTAIPKAPWFTLRNHNLHFQARDKHCECIAVGVWGSLFREPAPFLARSAGSLFRLSWPSPGQLFCKKNQQGPTRNQPATSNLVCCLALNLSPKRRPPKIMVPRCVNS